MDFNKLLSPKSRAELERRRQDTLSCYQMTNLELAQRLLDLAKEARAERTDLDLQVSTYDSSLIIALIPELASRLGMLVPGTREADIHRISDQDFRITVGVFIRNASHYVGGYAWQFLTNEACNGSPLVIAVDRLVPGDPSNAMDYIAVGLASVARSREVEYTGTWTPGMLDYKK